MAFDSEFLDKEYGKKIAQRKVQYQTAIDLFKKEFSKKHTERTLVCNIDEITTDLAYLYFYWSHHVVKPFVKNLSDRYKIAANTEFTIIYLQPLRIIDGSAQENVQVNAAFAFYVALNIILNFDQDNDGALNYSDPLLNFKGGIAPLEDRMEKIMENHRRYIITFNTQTKNPPIILNAFVWEMIDMFYKFQWQSLAI